MQPPDIDFQEAHENCSPHHHIFKTIEDAITCVETYANVEDDCQKVSTSFEATTSKDHTLSFCSETKGVLVKADTDECEQSSEDVFNVVVDASLGQNTECRFDQGLNLPPIIDKTKAVEWCEGEIFASAEEAVQCVEKHATAVDAANGCREVVIGVTSEQISNCQYTVTVSYFFL